MPIVKSAAWFLVFCAKCFDVWGRPWHAIQTHLYNKLLAAANQVSYLDIMSRIFDTKFGPTLTKELPASPGVYLFRDDTRKMRTIVRKASELTFEVADSEKEALLRENELIQRHRPMFNVAGAYSFLYPYLGIKPAGDTKTLALCLTTQPDLLVEQGFELFGAYRCREMVRDTYAALRHLLSFMGHEDAAGRRSFGRIPFTCICCFRQTALFVDLELRSYLRGESPELLSSFFTALLERAPARRDAGLIQKDFAVLKDFFHGEAKTLRHAMNQKGIAASWITQVQRDPLFIELK